MPDDDVARALRVLARVGFEGLDANELVAHAARMITAATRERDDGASRGGIRRALGESLSSSELVNVGIELLVIGLGEEAGYVAALRRAAVWLAARVESSGGTAQALSWEVVGDLRNALGQLDRSLSRNGFVPHPASVPRLRAPQLYSAIMGAAARVTVGEGESGFCRNECWAISGLTCNLVAGHAGEHSDGAAVWHNAAVCGGCQVCGRPSHSDRQGNHCRYCGRYTACLAALIERCPRETTWDHVRCRLPRDHPGWCDFTPEPEPRCLSVCGRSKDHRCRLEIGHDGPHDFPPECYEATVSRS